MQVLSSWARRRDKIWIRKFFFAGPELSQAGFKLVSVNTSHVPETANAEAALPGLTSLLIDLTSNAPSINWATHQNEIECMNKWPSIQLTSTDSSVQPKTFAGKVAKAVSFRLKTNETPLFKETLSTLVHHDFALSERSFTSYLYIPFFHIL